MARELPPFEPVTLVELRTIWSTHPDPDIRRLVLEVERYRRLIAEADTLNITIQQAWRDAVGGNMIALNLLHVLMTNERYRIPK